MWFLLLVPFAVVMAAAVDVVKDVYERLMSTGKYNFGIFEYWAVGRNHFVYKEKTFCVQVP